MLAKLLLPHSFKKIGWYLFIPSTIISILISITGYEASWLTTKVFAVFNTEFFGKSQYFTSIQANITNTMVGALFIVGAIFVGFSKEKIEDEFIENIRLSSLLWAVWVNYILLLFSFIFIYGTAFMSVMIYNMFTVMLIFILRFNYIIHRHTK